MSFILVFAFTFDLILRSAICRNPLFKTWTEALQEEVPLLVARSEIFKEMKPIVKYIELVQFQGGFIAGHYEVVFKVTIKRRL